MNYAGVPLRPFLRERLPLLAWRTASKVGVSRRRVAALSHRDRLSHQASKLLELMRRDNELAPEPYRAGEHWKRLNSEFDEWFRWEGIGAVETQMMNQFFASPPPTDPKLLRYAAWMLYRDLARRDKLGLLDKVSATVSEESGRSFRFDDRLVSWDQLMSVDHLYAIYDAHAALLTEACVLVDLGAGWGRLGYALRTANPQATYVVCDLPEVLLVASNYLPRIMPKETFHDYSQTREITRFDRARLKPGTWFLGAHHLERFEDGTADVFASVASFQEMPQSQVDAYFDVIDRKTAGTFYTLQLRSGRTHGLHLGEIAGFVEYPFRPHWKQEFIRSPAWSDLYFEAAFRIGG